MDYLYLFWNNNAYSTISYIIFFFEVLYLALLAIANSTLVSTVFGSHFSTYKLIFTFTAHTQGTILCAFRNFKNKNILTIFLLSIGNKKINTNHEYYTRIMGRVLFVIISKKRQNISMSHEPRIDTFIVCT